MHSLLFLSTLSLLLSLAITPAVRSAFRYLGVLDIPDRERKLHSAPVPRVGGVAILISYVLAFALLLCTNSSEGALVRATLPFVFRLLPAAGIAFLTGFVDDVLGLRAWQKIVGQAAAALLAYGAGIQIQVLGGQNLLHWWSCPVTVLWLIASMNALNLIDGVDGLAAGIGLVATTTTLLAAVIQLNVPLALATLPLAGSLLGFLRYNFNPATIFLGDCGSLFVGFMLGCFAVVWSEKSATVLGMAAPIVALCIPLLDTVLAISRRLLRREADLQRGSRTYSPPVARSRLFAPPSGAPALRAWGNRRAAVVAIGESSSRVADHGGFSRRSRDWHPAVELCGIRRRGKNAHRGIFPAASECPHLAEGL